ncbi:MAG TPA: AcvB/VirJ family lysyl-phosphatidylglycerol hydrolase [Gemmatirosa sp.]
MAHRFSFAAAALLASSAAAQQPATPDVRDLPLVEVPAAAAAMSPSPAAQHTFAILITGDGDWAAIDKGIAGAVAAGGVPVVGLKVRAYLEHGKRTPDGLTHDIERIARAYTTRWNRDRVMLLGFSRGAEFAPFIVNRMASDVLERVALVGMYGPEQNASFEFHFFDLFSNPHRASDIPVAPELARMVARPTPRAFCVYGADETESACKTGPDTPTLHKIVRGGAHHFDKDYPGLGRLAVEELAR